MLDISFLGLPIIYIITYFTLFVGIYTLSILLENKNNFTSPKPIKFPSISIIVPVYNGAKYVGDCISSLKNSDYPKNKLEILAIDDGSRDNSFDEIKKFECKNIKIYKKKHSGKGDTLNYGIERANGEIIGVTDDDCTVEKDTIRKMVGYFEEKDVAAVVSCVKVRNPKNFVELFQEIEYALTVFYRKIFSFVRGLFVTPGAISLYKAGILKKIGKFDNNNVTEDLEIGLRLLSRGYDIKCAIDAKTYTIVPKKFKDLQRQRVRWNYGLLTNLKKYSFLLSRKYGELGYLILPATITGYICILIFFSYIILTLVCSTINNISIFLIAGIEPILNNFLNFQFTLSFMQSELFFYSIATLTMGFIIVWYLRKHSLFTKTKTKTVLQYLIYIIVSGYLYFYFWVLTFYKILRKDIKW